MFQCSFCGNSVPPNTPCRLVTVATREVHYHERRTSLKNGKPVSKVINRPIPGTDWKGKKKMHYPDDPGGFGHEIVAELKACPQCAARHGVKV